MTTKKKTEPAVEAPVNEVVSIEEGTWTCQEHLAVVVDRPQDWTTQDYVDSPPPQVSWERPFDSI